MRLYYDDTISQRKQRGIEVRDTSENGAQPGMAHFILIIGAVDI